MDRDGESRLRALGRLVEQRRVALGLRPGELASRARLRNSAAIGGGVVRAFEIAGTADLVTIVRLVEVLEIDDRVVLKTCGMDLHALRQHWDEWAAVEVPITPTLPMSVQSSLATTAYAVPTLRIGGQRMSRVLICRHLM